MEVDGYPCWILAAGYMFSLGYFAVLVIIRALLLAVETRYAQVASKTRDMFEEDSTSVQSLPYSSRSITTLLKLMLGCKQFENLSIHELIGLKRSYLILSVVVYIPALICFLILISIVQPYQFCFDCDNFMELPITQVRIYI